MLHLLLQTICDNIVSVSGGGAGSADDYGYGYDGLAPAVAYYNDYDYYSGHSDYDYLMTDDLPGEPKEKVVWERASII